MHRSKRTVTRLGALFLFAGLLLPQTLDAQQGDPGTSRIRVFLECATSCDERLFRTTIDWVDWVRDRQDAQVHVLVTSQRTGTGGQRYQLDYLGLESLEGTDDQLFHTSLGTDVRIERDEAVTQVLAVGLARYAILVGGNPGLEVTQIASEQPTDRLVSAEEVNDPWDFWVFELNANGRFNGEATRSSNQWRGGFSADRTTETWKVELNARGSWTRNEIELSDSTIVDNRRDWSFDGELAYALARHWSIGAQGGVSAATRTNQDLSAGFGPAIEYSFWDYEEAPRRSLRAHYQIAIRHFEYEEETLFGFLEETRGAHELELSMSQRQPWGQVFANATAFQYLHDLSKSRFTTGGFMSFRVFRGLSLNVNGRVSWIRDQIFLAAEDISDEEILLQRRRLASDFDWNFGMGFTFQFGSIFNNVVNNRF